ncbi:hypothetical protein J5N97_003647 [Dioscorea zingiberensis]|uniref:CMP/dCMP-type deaminase domain-containing protein n=1 Tax=Dioscorea zingiberensis TaxID=325984 RepID=A0A9D5HQQ2_9LILI|nr:hypothetical protein J5N97_003647 [Dioscorea zingiberensis]
MKASHRDLTVGSLKSGPNSLGFSPRAEIRSSLRSGKKCVAVREKRGKGSQGEGKLGRNSSNEPGTGAPNCDRGRPSRRRKESCRCWCSLKLGQKLKGAEVHALAATAAGGSGPTGGSRMWLKHGEAAQDAQTAAVARAFGHRGRRQLTTKNLQNWILFQNWIQLQITHLISSPSLLNKSVVEDPLLNSHFCTFLSKMAVERILISTSNNAFMELALDQARIALENLEVPVGCVIVEDGNVIASGRNRTTETRNATRHAEMDAIDSVLEKWQKIGLDHLQVAEKFSKCDIYVTCEPCIMCASALSILG